MKSDRPCHLAALLLAAVLVAPRAAADDIDDHAAAALRRGNSAFREGRFADAEQAYREAFAVKKGYDIAGNLGAAELSLGRLRDAAEHLAFTLRLFPITGDPALRERMEAAFEQCKKGVGTVHVQAKPPGAEVWVDGTPLGAAPLADDVFVDPGEHVFVARMEGHATASERVLLRAGAELTITLAPAPLPKPGPNVVHMAAPKRRSPIPAIALGGAAILGLGTGAALLGLSAGRKSDAATARSAILGVGGSCVAGAGNYDGSRCPSLSRDLRADDRLHDAGAFAFTVGAVAAAGAAAYLLWPEKKAPSGRELRVTPTFGDKSGAVIFSGAF